MRNRSRITFTVLLAILLSVTLGGIASAATLTVGPGQTYTTIQAAVDSADEGDTINVKAGTYGENIYINTNNLVLKSVDGDGLAVIEGNGSGNVIHINSPLGITIDGFTIDGNGYDGIHHDGGTVTDPVAITDNTILDCNYGFYSDFDYMEGSTFTFTGNSVTEATGVGIYVYGFDGCTINISNNTFTDCDYGMDVEEFSEGVESHAYINNNTVIATSGFSGEYGIYSCCAERTSEFNNNVVSGDYTYGMYFEDLACCGMEPAVVYIENNQVTGCEYGIYFDEIVCCFPAEVYIRGNTLTGNDTGLYVSSFNYSEESTVVVENNNIAGNSGMGFDNYSGYDITADNNWWGDASGPSGVGTGSGDSISTEVIVTSFLSTPYTEETTTTTSSGSGGCNIGFLTTAGLFVVLPLLFLLRRK